MVVMRHTNEIEKEMEAAMSVGTTYWDCFKGTNRRRSEIVMIGWLIQCMSSLRFL
jgi:SP family general alpha glucoside:H+ symporter-like MFS transporter